MLPPEQQKNHVDVVGAMGNNSRFFMVSGRELASAYQIISRNLTELPGTHIICMALSHLLFVSCSFQYLSLMSLEEMSLI